MWPERAKTGMARLALASGAPVVPVAIWGSHEVIAYHGRRQMMADADLVAVAAPDRSGPLRSAGRPVRPGLGAVGHAQRASDRIMDAIAAELAPLRKDEPRLPRFRDHTRPVSLARVRAVTRPSRSD